MGNRGKPLGRPWHGFWEHLGRGQAAGRPGADKGKHEGNTMVGRALPKPWNRLWETLGRRWGNLGKTWETLGAPWTNLEDLGELFKIWGGGMVWKSQLACSGHVTAAGHLSQAFPLTAILADNCVR
eukprot:gene12698-biopygen2227